ncbi:MAG: hypothetical protein R3B13_05950 [Polyangiaceae bacterium]
MQRVPSAALLVLAMFMALLPVRGEGVAANYRAIAAAEVPQLDVIDSRRSELASELLDLDVVLGLPVDSRWFLAAILGGIVEESEVVDQWQPDPLLPAEHARGPPRHT